MARGTTARRYLDGYTALESVLEFDSLTAYEIAEAFDLEREDPLLNPWKRGYNAAIRSAFGQ